jgi:CspA family cold shock protein
MTAPSIEFKTGTLKWFDVNRGFGFLIPDEAGPDVFVHANLFKKREIEPEQFMRLQYRDTRGKKGLMAFDIMSAEKQALH